jgi:hypothetical protein
MDDGDYRQQQEAEEERMMETIEVLNRVDRGLATHDDVEFLAAELGLSTKIKEAA